MFLEEFSNLLNRQVSQAGDVITMGDFNFHYEAQNHPDIMGLKEIITSFAIVQQVTDPIPSRRATCLISLQIMLKVAGGATISHQISDLYTVHTSLDIDKPMPQREVRVYRKTRSIDQGAFLDDLKASELLVSAATTLPESVDLYNNTLLELLDKHTPLKIVLTVRPDTSWMNALTLVAHKEHHCSKHRWKQSRSSVALEQFKIDRARVNISMIDQTRALVSALLT